jgi:probable rRNA maturation factor
LVIVRKSVAGLSEAAFSRFVRRAARAVGLRGEVNVLVTTSREVRSLNRRFRGKNKPTDVLSFPPMQKLPEDFAGDIAIAVEVAAQNGKRVGHTPAEEVKILAVHGLLHLAGYDHERDNGTMARKEQRLRRMLGLPVGLIERTPKAFNRKERKEEPQRTRRRVAGRNARATRSR